MNQPGFEERAGLQLATAMIPHVFGNQGQQRLMPQAINVDAEGNESAARRKHIWMVDPTTGQRVSYVGPITSPDPQPRTLTGGRTASSELSARRLAIQQSKITAQALGVEGIVSNPQTGELELQFKNPEDSEIFKAIQGLTFDRLVSDGQIGDNAVNPFTGFNNFRMGTSSDSSSRGAGVVTRRNKRFYRNDQGQHFPILHYRGKELIVTEEGFIPLQEVVSILTP